MKEIAVKVENLSVYYGKTPAITDVSLDIPKGEYLGIIGPNGSGKTTLLKSIAGLIPVKHGEIFIFDKKIEKKDAIIGYVPQISMVDRKFPITALEVVMTGKMKEGLAPFFKFTKSDKEISQILLDKVGIEHLKDRQISELSGGEFQKMLIARALAMNPDILLLDEPTANVDVKSNEQIYNLLNELNRKVTIILVTHDLFAVSSHVHKIACLNGRLVYHGEPELNQEIVNSLYGCPVDLIAHGVPHRVLKHHEEVE